MSLNKSLHTTWNLFNIAPKRFAHTSMILAPTLITVGSFFFLAMIIPVGFAVLISAVLFIVTISVMVSTSEEEDQLVQRYLDPPSQREYIPPVDLSTRPKEIHPDYYQGAGEWIAPGHVDHFLFVETVRELDPYVRALPDRYIYSLVKYGYIINTYSHRTNRDAIKFVSEDTPNSYPVTHIHVPYDHYVHTRYPYPAPVVDPPSILEDTGSHEIIYPKQ